MKFIGTDQIKYAINVKISGIDQSQYAILRRITDKFDTWDNEDSNTDFDCLEGIYNPGSIELVFERKWSEISEASLMKFCKEIMYEVNSKWKSIDYVVKDFTYFFFNMVYIWGYDNKEKMKFKGKHDIDYEFSFSKTKINPDSLVIGMNCDELNIHPYFGTFSFSDIYNVTPFIMSSICHDHRLVVSYKDIEMAVSYVALHATSHPDEDEITQDIKFETRDGKEFTGKMYFKLERRNV